MISREKKMKTLPIAVQVMCKEKFIDVSHACSNVVISEDDFYVIHLYNNKEYDLACKVRVNDQNYNLIVKAGKKGEVYIPEGHTDHTVHCNFFKYDFSSENDLYMLNYIQKYEEGKLYPIRMIAFNVFKHHWVNFDDIAEIAQPYEREFYATIELESPKLFSHVKYKLEALGFRCKPESSPSYIKAFGPQKLLEEQFNVKLDKSVGAYSDVTIYSGRIQMLPIHGTESIVEICAKNPPSYSINDKVDLHTTLESDGLKHHTFADQIKGFYVPFVIDPSNFNGSLPDKLNIKNVVPKYINDLFAVVRAKLYLCERDGTHTDCETKISTRRPKNFGDMSLTEIELSDLKQDKKYILALFYHPRAQTALRLDVMNAMQADIVKGAVKLNVDWKYRVGVDEFVSFLVGFKETPEHHGVIRDMVAPMKLMNVTLISTIRNLYAIQVHGTTDEVRRKLNESNLLYLSEVDYARTKN